MNACSSWEFAYHHVPYETTCSLIRVKINAGQPLFAIAPRPGHTAPHPTSLSRHRSTDIASRIISRS